MSLEMKKIFAIFILFLLMPICVFAAGNKSDANENQSEVKEELRYVSADSIGLKEKASIRGKDFYVLVYAEVVVVEEEKDKWTFVHVKENPAIKGWISTSALSKRKIVANGRARFMEADEIALAGKGLDKSLNEIQKEQDISDIIAKFFGETEEKNYYDFLENIDSTSVNQQELFDFIDDGKLKLQD